MRHRVRAHLAEREKEQLSMRYRLHHSHQKSSPSPDFDGPSVLAQEHFGYLEEGAGHELLHARETPPPHDGERGAIL